MNNTGRAALMLLAAALPLGAIGCAPETVSQQPPTLSPEPEPHAEAKAEANRESVAPEQGTAPVQIPECDAANPLAAQESHEFFTSIETDVSALTGPVDLETFTRLSGPVAQQAMERAEDLHGCQWPLYLAGNNLVQYTVVLPADAETTLVAGLRNSDFVESTLGPATLFTHSVDDPQGYRMTGSTTIQYLLLDGVWLSIFETGESDYAPSALDALIALNPGRFDSSPAPRA